MLANMLERMLHHKLLKEGQQGHGVVTERHDQAAETGTRSYSFRFELRGHIKFPDGAQTEFKSEWLSSHNVGDIREGAIVPVRSDPSDHSQVVLDVVALAEQHKGVLARDKAWVEQSNARRIADADAQAAQANASGTEPRFDVPPDSAA
jgi:hypothetical protein